MGQSDFSGLGGFDVRWQLMMFGLATVLGLVYLYYPWKSS